MMRLMLMPLRFASSETEPVTEVSSWTSPPARARKRTGRRKLEMPTCWMPVLAPLIRLSGPFCRSGSVST